LIDHVNTISEIVFTALTTFSGWKPQPQVQKHFRAKVPKAQGEKSAFRFADNGAEFTGQLVDLWAYHHDVRIDFSRPGTPPTVTAASRGRTHGST
jgi:transposase InsO family protein